MSRGIDRIPEGFAVKLVRSRPECDKCPPAQEPAATLLGEYQALTDDIETTQALCHNKSEEMMRDGQTVGIYCASNDQEYYFAREV